MTNAMRNYNRADNSMEITAGIDEAYTGLAQYGLKADIWYFDNAKDPFLSPRTKLEIIRSRKKSITQLRKFARASLGGSVL